VAIEQPFTDPIITQKRGKDLPYLTIQEEIYVDNNGKAILTEIPYKYDRVQILEQSGGAGAIDSVDGGAFTDSSTSGSETVICMKLIKEFLQIINILLIMFKGLLRSIIVKLERNFMSSILEVDFTTFLLQEYLINKT
jgi:hypothetical protein